MRFVYPMLVASSLAYADSVSEAGNSSTAAHYYSATIHDYPATVHSLAATQDSYPRKRLLRPEGTLNDEARAVVGSKSISLKAKVFWSQIKGESLDGALSKLKNRYSRTKQGFNKMLAHRKMEVLKRRYKLRRVTEELAKSYGNFELASLLAHAKSKKGKGAEMARDMSEELCKIWVADKESADTVFGILNLQDTRVRREFEDFSWKVTFLDDFITTLHHETLNKKVLIEVLAKRFHGWENFVITLYRAKKSNSAPAKKTAEELLSDMPTVWKINEWNPSTIVIKLRLPVKPEFFTDLNLETITNYVKYCHGNEGFQPHLVKALSDGYNNDGKLAIVLIDKNKLDLLGLLFEKWKKSRVTLDDVFSKHLQHVTKEHAKLVYERFREHLGGE